LKPVGKHSFTGHGARNLNDGAKGPLALPFCADPHRCCTPWPAGGEAGAYGLFAYGCRAQAPWHRGLPDEAGPAQESFFVAPANQCAIVKNHAAVDTTRPQAERHAARLPDGVEAEQHLSRGGLAAPGAHREKRPAGSAQDVRGIGARRFGVACEPDGQMRVVYP